MNMRDFNKCFSRCSRDFKGLTEASGVIQPGESGEVRSTIHSQRSFPLRGV